MAKPNAYVEISGNLLEKEAVLERIRQLSHEYSVVIGSGGGEQINAEFKRRGFKIKFGIMGRITTTLEQRQAARDVLEINQANIQDMLDERGISARVAIPVNEESTVLCHRNGDLKILEVYNGYDKIFRFTQKDRVEEKKEFIRLLEIAFQYLMKTEDRLDKIVIEGF